MRAHGDFALFDLWSYGAPERALAGADSLAVARFECIEREGAAFGWFDLVWERAGLHTVLCGVLVDLVAAARNDERALIFPRAAQRLIDDDAAGELAALLVPQVRLLASRRVIPLEDVVRRAPSPAFDRAREAGELGAAPLTIALARVARWNTALDRANGAAVALHARDRALGTALAARRALPLAGPARATDAQWYTIPVAYTAGAAHTLVADELVAPDAAIVRIAFDKPAAAAGAHGIPVIAPVPIDRVFSNDLTDGPAAFRIWVAAPAERVAAGPTRTALPYVNRVGLRIALVVRPDFAQAPDADTDEAHELAVRLRAAGFAAELTANERPAQPGEAVLPIVFGGLDDPYVHRTAAHFTASRHPFAMVLQPDAPAAPWYDDGIGSIARSAIDERELHALLDAFDRSAASERAPAQPSAELDFAALGSNVVGAALVRIAATDRIDDLEARLGRAGLPVRAFGPVIPHDDAPPAHAAVPGERTFAFVHAPAVPSAGLAAIVLALRDADIPLVIATSAPDPALLATLRRIAGVRTTFVIDATPRQLATFYATATLFIDASLRPRGLARLVRAARAGAIPIAFRASPLAQVLPAECIMTRVAVMDVRDTVSRLWHAADRYTLRPFVQRTIGVPLGSEANVAGAVQQLLGTIFERVMPGA